MHYACRVKDIKTVDLLVKNGANVNLIGDYGRTPLHCAVFDGGLESVPIIELLRTHGADTETRDTFGQTPAKLARVELVGGPALASVISSLS